MAEFDPYHEWLGISPEERPINHYSLLSLRCFESNTKVIANAADRQMTFVRTFQTGPHSKESQEILNELSKARVTLLNPEKKRAYDAKLRTEQSARQVPLPPPIPPLKRPEPPVLPQPKRSEPMIQSVSKRPEPVVRLVPKRPEPTVQSVSKRPEPVVKPSSDQPIFSTRSIDPDDVQLRNALEVYKKSPNPAWEVLKQVLLTEKYHFVWKVKREFGTQNYQTKHKNYAVTKFDLKDAILAFLNYHVFLGISNNYDEGDIYLKPSKAVFKNITEEVISLDASGALEIIMSKVYSIEDHALTMANVVDWVWEHAKKNGGKDLRYKKNKKIHIVECFKLEIYVSKIEFGSYLFGNERLARLFVSALLQKDPSSVRFATKPITVKGKGGAIKSKNVQETHSLDYLQEMDRISRLEDGEFILRNGEDISIYSQPVPPVRFETKPIIVNCKKQTPSDKMSEMDYLSKMIEEEFIQRIYGDDDYIYSDRIYSLPAPLFSPTKKNEEKKRDRNDGENSSFQDQRRRENVKSFNSPAANNNNNNTKNGDLTNEEKIYGWCGCVVVLIIIFLLLGLSD